MFFCLSYQLRSTLKGKNLFPVVEFFSLQLDPFPKGSDAQESKQEVKNLDSQWKNSQKIYQVHVTCIFIPMNPIALRMAQTPLTIVQSEWNRVKPLMRIRAQYVSLTQLVLVWTAVEYQRQSVSLHHLATPDSKW